MARPHPGQLTLFDEFAAPLAMSAAAMPPPLPVAAEPPPGIFTRPSNDLAGPRGIDPGWGPDPVFFAVMASSKAAGDLVAAGDAQREAFGLDGWRRPAYTLHISVLGAGQADDLGEEDIDLLKEAGDAVAMGRFKVSFGEAMSFRRRSGAMPLVLPCDDGAAELAGLAETLRSGLRERGFTLRSKLDALYHLTLAYDRIEVPRTPLAEPIRMPVRDFVLIRSHRSEGRYEELQKWTLAS